MDKNYWADIEICVRENDTGASASVLTHDFCVDMDLYGLDDTIENRAMVERDMNKMMALVAEEEALISGLERKQIEELLSIASANNGVAQVLIDLDPADVTSALGFLEDADAMSRCGITDSDRADVKTLYEFLMSHLMISIGEIRRSARQIWELNLETNLAS